MNLSLRDLDVRGKRVLVRVDFNVPMEERDGDICISRMTRAIREVVADDQLSARAWREDHFDGAFRPAEGKAGRRNIPCDRWRIICTR